MTMKKQTNKDKILAALTESPSTVQQVFDRAGVEWTNANFNSLNKLCRERFATIIWEERKEGGFPESRYVRGSK